VYRLFVNSNDSYMCGQLLTRLGLSDLAAALAGTGHPSAVRESSHYVGGRYVRVAAGSDDATCSFERVSDQEYIARGDAASFEALAQFTAALSRTLSAGSVKHRFEIYDGEDAVRAYLHFDWPVREES
jgi:hypothetical protein